MYWKVRLAHDKAQQKHGWTYCRPNTPEQTPRAFILKNNLDAMQNTAILLHALVLCLQFTLQL